MVRWAVTSEKILTLEQIDALLTWLAERRDLALARGGNLQAIKDYYILKCLLETGLRVAEFCNLIEDDLQGLRLLVRKGKGGKPRTVLLTRSTVLMLQEWIKVKRRLGYAFGPTEPMFPTRLRRKYTTRGIQHRIDYIFEAVGLPPRLSTHSTRHTYASLLLATGKVSLATVKENLGHHSIAVTNLYAHAVGDLSDIELYPSTTSHKEDFCEVEKPRPRLKRRNPVTSFLSNAKFSGRGHNRHGSGL